MTIENSPRLESNPTFKNPEELQNEEKNKILKLVLEKYGVDLKDFKKDLNEFNNMFLTYQRTKPLEAIELDKKAEITYQNYLKEQINSGNTEKIVNIDNLTASINNERLTSLKNELDKPLNEALNKYDFLNNQSKEFIKLGFLNSLVKSPINKIGESIIGGVGSFIGNLETGKLDNILDSLSSSPVDSGRVLSMKEEFIKHLGTYTSKLDEINQKFLKEDGLKGLTKDQKQNIISNIDWFRDPGLIENGPQSLDISKIDFTKTTKNEAPLDSEKLSKYLVSSREKFVQLGNKLNLGDKASDALYNVLGNSGKLSEVSQKLVDILLKVPILGKFLAMFLGLNGDNPFEELKENTKNFKILKGFKDLGVSKDEKGNIIPGSDIFKETDLSRLNFNSLKDELKEINGFFNTSNEKDYKSLWISAFSENGIGETEPKLKLKIDKKIDDKKLTTQDFKEILKTGIDELKEQKEKKSQEDTLKKANDETQKKQKEIDENNTALSTKQLALNILRQNKGDNGKDIISNIGNLGDYNDFKKITIGEILNNNDLDNLLKTKIGESDYQKISEEVKNGLKKSIEIVKEYLNGKSVNTNISLKELLENSEFLNFLNEKNKSLKTDLTKLESEKKFFGEKEKKIEFSKKVESILNNLTTKTSLKDGIIIKGDKKIKFNDDKNELQIGEEKYSLSLKDKSIKIKDIKIDHENVYLEGQKNIFSGEEIHKKDLFIKGIGLLVQNGEYKNNKLEIVKI
ncbi:hypothetical protein H3C61_01115 [Candidatus Gracilibacteria bacterium]|nr:hypothetical protein [Candidatus Gracilibacteria bacterium]